jgi:hypothetical protein
MFSRVEAAKMMIEGLQGICWRPPRAIPWNPDHTLLLGQVDKMFHVKR